MKVAFVVQRYGEEVCGGAETLCRQVAQRMAKHWDVEILTTCAVDDHTWANEYPTGVEVIRDVTVRRFPVDHPRDLLRMRALNDRVFSGFASLRDQIDWMVAQGPHSTVLYEFLGTAAGGYDFVIFFTYLYAPTVFGVSLVPGMCALVPTAHDEPPIYMSIFRRVFQGVRALLFSTPAEQAFVNGLFGTREVLQEVVGVGIEPPDCDGARFRRAHEVRLEGSPIILYAGRINEGKGCRMLLSHFSRFCEELPEYPVKLVLIGAKQMDLPDHPQIVPLGFVSEQERLDAFAAATVVVQPSPYESLSMVALEAWQVEKPLLANGACEVLRSQCIGSNGGLWYESYAEFRDELALLLADAELRKALGGSGRRFVEQNYTWDAVESKFLRVVARALTEGSIGYSATGARGVARPSSYRELRSYLEEVIRGTQTTST